MGEVSSVSDYRQLHKGINILFLPLCAGVVALTCANDAAAQRGHAAVRDATVGLQGPARALLSATGQDVLAPHGRPSRGTARGKSCRVRSTHIRCRTAMPGEQRKEKDKRI